MRPVPGVRQRTLLNLGRHFDIDRERWPPLCQRVEAALAGQTDLFDDVPANVEREAQRIVAQLVARGAQPDGDLQTVAVDSLALVRPRSVGAEHVALWALAQLGLPALLESLGVNAALRDAALGSIVARMAFPASERATHRWLRERSAVGELLGVDFETVGAILERDPQVLHEFRQRSKGPAGSFQPVRVVQEQFPRLRFAFLDDPAVLRRWKDLDPTPRHLFVAPGFACLGVIVEYDVEVVAHHREVEHFHGEATSKRL